MNACQVGNFDDFDVFRQGKKSQFLKRIFLFIRVFIDDIFRKMARMMFQKVSQCINKTKR